MTFNKFKNYLILLLILVGIVLSLGVRNPQSTIYALLPPIAAILLSWSWRRVLLGMLAGVFTGALILTQINPITATGMTVWDLLIKTAIEKESLEIFLFTLLLAGMVGIMIHSGAIRDLVIRLSPIARGRRTGQLLVEALGILVFFDDYANTMVVGATARPITDRLGISRAKLAYLVDSTAAPVASLALISTWIGIEISYLGQQMQYLGGFSSSGYGVFLHLIPFRLYCIFTLIMLSVIAITGRDFGPMLDAEKRAIKNRDSNGAQEGQKAHYLGAVIPVMVVLVSVLASFLIQGAHELHTEIKFWSAAFWRDAFVAVDDSSFLLDIAAINGFLVAWCIAVCSGKLSVFTAIKAALRAMKSMLPALGLLILAQALRKVTDNNHLQTADYLIHLLSNVNITLLPISIFLVAAAVAFATGTSWGTMGILIPVAVPLAASSVKHFNGDPNLILLSTAAVLDGAVFGDHCSPISDTTVMSSIGSSCDHLTHVKTQIPYALTAMSIAAVVGYLGYPLLGIGSSVILLIGTGLLLTIVMVFGKRA